MIEKEKYTLFDYLKWRGDLSFYNDSENVIDFAILSQLPLFSFQGLLDDNNKSIKDLVKDFFEKNYKKGDKVGLIIPDREYILLKKLRQYNRYKNIIVIDYKKIISDTKEEQFIAMTLLIGSKMCVVFSGTDDSVVGWKENLDLIYKDITPAQSDSVIYLNEIITKYKDYDFYVIGHSKGGNLALFASLNIDDSKQKRLKKVYCFDGPGLNIDEANKHKNNPILNKIISIMPYSSAVGILFNHIEKVLIVNSLQQGFYQHDVMGWQVKVNDFVYLDEFNKDVIEYKNLIDEILKNMSYEEKYKFASNLYNLLSSAGVNGLLDLKTKYKKVIEMYFKLSKQDKKYIYDPLIKLSKCKFVKQATVKSFKIYLDERKIEKKRNIIDEENHID